MIKILIEYNQEKTYFECNKNVTIRSILKKYCSIKNLEYEHIYGVNNGDNIALNEFKRLKLKKRLTKDEIKRGIMKIQAQYTQFERTKSSITTNSMLEAADEKDYNKINEIKDKNLINLLNIDKGNNEDNNYEEEEEDEEEIIDENDKIDYMININDNDKDEVLIPNKMPNNLKDENYKN